MQLHNTMLKCTAIVVIFKFSCQSKTGPLIDIIKRSNKVIWINIIIKNCSSFLEVNCFFVDKKSNPYLFGVQGKSLYQDT